MHFLDFYAGAGGWSLGLTLAGHTSAGGFEIWPVANQARSWNLGEADEACDIRALDVSTLPAVPLVVGSPPCTQFSYANKGGNGDIADGLKDIRAFLAAVRASGAEYWLLENVPRTAEILRRETSPGGALEEFSDLFDEICVFDMSDFGVPQRRQRCIAGRFPFDLLRSYRGRLPTPTLGTVLERVSNGVDPVWGFTASDVTDRDIPEPLSWEEERINREKKALHPIYNGMSFPDDPAKPSRTVTATCTRVSRESIVVPHVHGGHRLLSVREAAALQSFPITYQFPAVSKSDRMTMAGNAIPPLFTYLVGLAAAGVPAESVSLPKDAFQPQRGMAAPASGTRRSGRTHRSDRAFRAAIAGLHFKSGMTFDLSNRSNVWRMSFSSGNMGGKSFTVTPRGEYRELAHGLSSRTSKQIPISLWESILVKGCDLQQSWAAAAKSGIHPFTVIDSVSRAASIVAAEIDQASAQAYVEAVCLGQNSEPSQKMLENAVSIAAGLLIAAKFNQFQMATENSGVEDLAA